MTGSVKRDVSKARRAITKIKRGPQPFTLDVWVLLEQNSGELAEVLGVFRSLADARLHSRCRLNEWVVRRRVK